MTSRSYRALVGALSAGLLALPLVAAAAKPAPKKPAKPAKPAPAKGDAKAGKALFQTEGCSGCHKTKDFTSGNTDISTVGKTMKAADISAYIRKPKSPVMPAYKGPQKNVDNLTAYLLTQK